VGVARVRASERPLAAIVLAAGEGKRFRSRIPKVLYPLCGRPLLAHALAPVVELAPTRLVVVVGRGAAEVEAVARRVAGRRIVVARQARRLGTADAARVGDEALGRFAGDVLVLPGDAPLLTAATLRRLLERHRAAGAAATLLTALLDDPTGYGRVVRGPDGAVERIVEETDATEEERTLREVSSGVWAFDRAALRAALTRVDRPGAQGELYLTDVVEILRDKGEAVEAVRAADPTEVLGVNSRAQLAAVAALLRRRINERLMTDGVTIVDPAVTYVDAEVTVEPDAVLHPFTHLRGRTVVGAGAELGPHAELADTVVGEGARVRYAVVEGARIGPGAEVGPFARLRPGAELAEGARVGTFVEVKQSRIGRGSKVPHLSYIGDAEIGRNVNVGAGTITCNYDGETGAKSRTVVEDDALIGSDTMLVAPVRVGRGAVTGAGSVVTRDLPPGQVALGAPARPVRRRKPAGRRAPGGQPTARRATAGEPGRRRAARTTRRRERRR
jgi:bifunctional UDP-N-acetylglucosamine pyrophosphorylase/glucosamine-1-phosphate N-acetyltransferase